MGFLETYIEKKSECKMLTRNHPLYKAWDGRRAEQQQSKYNANSVEGGALRKSLLIQSYPALVLNHRALKKIFIRVAVLQYCAFLNFFACHTVK